MYLALFAVVLLVYLRSVMVVVRPLYSEILNNEIVENQSNHWNLPGGPVSAVVVVPEHVLLESNFQCTRLLQIPLRIQQM
jgi:hypothetical protein